MAAHKLPFHFHRRRSPTMKFNKAADKTAAKMLPESATFHRRRTLTVALFFSVVSLSCLVLFVDLDSLRFLPRFSSYSVGSFSALPYFFPSVADDPLVVSNEYTLEKVLKDASMEDRTVILTTLNEAWADHNSVIDLFLESFRIGDGTRRLLNHLVIIALDREAFKRCLIVHAHCYSLVSEGVDFHREAFFMTPGYLKMMWRRIDFLRSVLEMGYNFVFTDADIMWFRNPFPSFYSDADFQIACDHFIGSSDNVHNKPNGGLNYVQSNNRSIEFYKFWYASRETYPRYHDQDVLNIIKFHPFIRDIGLKMRFLDTAYYGGLCEPSKDLNKVCTMHANCCFGLDSKLHDLKIMLQDWRHYLSLPPSLKRLSIVSWRVPQKCSLDSLHQYDSLELETSDEQGLPD
ncbi:Glycosyltransferase [Quillaja saponaria]|uniref:Glycosyltransferase n=1 Tax=Quillaja saponaria TaxID=32244 RepID=A0AAD7LBZ1_QUISA|nr:Glycosyltransferase [Quillaja saponaria]